MPDNRGNRFTRIGIIVVAASALLAGSLAGASAAPAPYNNFKVTVYIPISIVERMAHDPAWMASSWKKISSRLHVDTVFIETYRGGMSADDATITRVKQFFVSQGVGVAGGMAMAGPGGFGQFQSLDYMNAQDRALVARMSAFTARHFNEIILDDFFFNNTKSLADIKAKGAQSWDDFRLHMMDNAARNLIMKPALAANPKVRIIIKFPNWYPSFQGLGYNLAQEPKIFPEIWTGDETRDPVDTDQQLQQYESYEIFRYLENVAPGRNGGGWIDPYNIRYLDRYAEQLWDTILAKAPAMNLFEYSDLLRAAQPGDRSAWQMDPTTFNYFDMLRECCGGFFGPRAKPPLMADVAAYALRQVDDVAGDLGKPEGLAVYRPLQSSGEDFLEDVLGMIGVPIEMYPTWPDAKTVLLTEAAKKDPAIVSEIESHLRDGDNVIITSGLLKAIQDKGLSQITDLHTTGRTLGATSYVAGFGAGSGAEAGASHRPIFFPEIHFYTNEDWAVVRGLADGRGVPLVLMDHYAKGTLYVLTIPENMNDLYRLPPSTLEAIRGYLENGLPVRMEGPAKTSLFEYDNGTFVAESFLDHPVAVRITGAFSHIENISTGTVLAGEPLPTFRFGRPPAAHLYGFELQIEPHSFEAFREQP